MRAHQLAQLRPPRLPGLRRGARRALRDRRGDARDRQPADRRQRHRLPRGVLDAVPGDVVADAVDPFAVRQRRGGGHRRRRRAARRKGSAATCASSPRAATAARPTSASAACPGMFERNDDVLYICYDNEAYMNTGVQRSLGDAAGGAHRDHAGGRPAARQRLRHRARTCRGSRWRTRFPTSRPRRVADLRDLEAKVARAMEHRAARATCTSSCPARSAGARRRQTRSSIARLARETGLFPVFEAEHGEVTRVHQDPPARCRSRST